MKPKKKKDNQNNKLLVLLFIGLLILTIILLILVINKNNKMKKAHEGNLAIPILEDKTTNELSVNLKELKGKEYIFKIINYKDNKIISEDLSYNIEIENKNKTNIKIYKNDSKKNLISSDDKLSVIKDNVLPKNKKMEDVYKIVLSTNKNITSKDTIKIIIKS